MLFWRVLHPKATALERQQTVQHTQLGEVGFGSRLVSDKDQGGDAGRAGGVNRRQKAHVGSPSPVNGGVPECGEPVLNQWPTAGTQHHRKRHGSHSELPIENGRVVAVVRQTSTHQRRTQCALPAMGVPCQ